MAFIFHALQIKHRVDASLCSVWTTHWACLWLENIQLSLNQTPSRVVNSYRRSHLIGILIAFRFIGKFFSPFAYKTRCQVYSCQRYFIRPLFIPTFFFAAFDPRKPYLTENRGFLFLLQEAERTLSVWRLTTPNNGAWYIQLIEALSDNQLPLKV